MTKNLISVLMIAYNQELYIQQAIEGICSQKCDYDIELIISDDCSTDSTQNIIEHLKETNESPVFIRYFAHKNNLGMMANFIFALKQCKGEYVAICEGDDYWTDCYKLQKQADYLDANHDISISFHKVQILLPDNKLKKDFITRPPKNYKTLFDLATHQNQIHTPSVMYRNFELEFPPEMHLSKVGDFFLYMLLAQHGNIGFIDETMAVYRYGSGVWSSKDSNERTHPYNMSLAYIFKYFELRNEKVAEIIGNALTKNIIRARDHISCKELSEIHSVTKSIKVLSFNVLQEMKRPANFTMSFLINAILKKIQLKFSRRD